MKKILTKEEKELVIKDLLLRTQTDVLVKVSGEDEPKEIEEESKVSNPRLNDIIKISGRGHVNVLC